MRPGSAEHQSPGAVEVKRVLGSRHAVARLNFPPRKDAVT